MADPKTVTVQEVLRLLSLTVCVALCLTMGAFGVDYALRHGHGWWLPIVLIVPPLVAILTQFGGRNV